MSRKRGRPRKGVFMPLPGYEIQDELPGERDMFGTLDQSCGNCGSDHNKCQGKTWHNCIDLWTPKTDYKRKCDEHITTESWHTGTKPEDKLASTCSLAQDECKIILTQELYLMTRKLCSKVKEEWQMLLSGEMQGNDVFLNGYYIPKQEITGASVKNLDCIDKKFIEENKILATIHSHSSMKTFFSSVDMNDTNLQSLHYHIVTNNDGEFTAAHKVVLPCGLFKMVDAKIQLEESTSDITGIENITKRGAYDTARSIY